MPTNKSLQTLFSILLSGILIVSCAAPTISPTPVPTYTPEATATLRPTPTVTPAPTEDPDAPLQASLNPALDLENYIPVQPFTVAFSYAMDPASAKTALVAYPDVPGILEWNRDYTSLTFSPDPAFTPGQDYFFFLDRGLQDTRGKSFEKIQQWKLHTSPSPRVVDLRADKTSPTELRPSYTLTFDRLMDRVSVAKAISIKPVVDLQLSWKKLTTDTRDVLTIAVLSQLVPGQDYVFTLGRGASGLDGIEFSVDTRWNYQPAALQVVLNSVLADSIDFSTNYALDMKDPGKFLAFDPPLQGQWEMISGIRVKFIPSEPLAYAEKYSLVAVSPLPGKDGNQLPIFEPVAIELDPPISINQELRYLPEFTSPVTVSFDVPVDPASVETALTISPSIAVNFEWQNGNKTLLIHPGQKWPANQTVTTCIGTGATDAEGRPILSGPYSFIFNTPFDYGYSRQNAVFADLGSRFQAVNAEGRRAVQYVNHADGSTATVGLTPLTMGEFARLFSQCQKDNNYFTYYYDTADFSCLNGLTPQKTWPITVKQKSFTELTIPSDVPPGLYILSLSDSPTFTDYLFLALTTRLLTVKTGQGRLYTWSTDFAGQPSAGMDVRLYGEGGAHLLEGRADENGLWLAPISDDVNITLVLASHGAPQGMSLSGDVAVAGLDRGFITPENQPVFSNFPESSREDTGSARAYIYTDRPIYRPGQSVNFKIILRNELDVRYTLPPLNTPLKVSVMDARSNIVSTYNLATNEFGSTAGTFDLAEGGMLGSYQISVEALGQTNKQTFEVQEYQKPEFEVTIQPSVLALVGGDVMDVDVEVRYFTGQPVAEARLVFTPYVNDRYYFLDYSWEEANWIFPGLSIPNGKTDANGHYHFSFSVPPVNNSYYSYYNNFQKDWMLQVDVSDASGAVVGQGLGFTVYPSNEKVRLAPSNGYRAQIGQAITTAMQVTDVNGALISGRMLNAKLVYYYTRDYRSSLRVPDQTTSITTDNAGKAVVSLAPNTVGWYMLEVSGTDPKGNQYSDRTWFYVSTTAYTERNDQSVLAVSVDKSQASPYDTVHIRIESDFSGPALLTFERGSVQRVISINLTAPMTEITQELGEETIPNIFVKVSAWLPSDTLAQFNNIVGADPWLIYSLPEANLRVASTEIKVDNARKQLTVELIPDQAEYQPGEEAAFTIRVTGPDGQPTRAEISLAVVDEAIFSLKSDPAQSILDAFYGLRNNNTQSFDEMAPVRRMFNPGASGGGGGWPGVGNPRSQFADTALWLPQVTTDENGQASVKVTLPDNLTRWRITARAITYDTLVGQTQASITTTRALVVRPLLPNSLTLGDRSELGVLVTNTTGQAQSAQVNLQAAPGSALTGTDPGARQIDLKPGETGLLTWTVTAAQEATVQLTLTALGASPEISDAIQVPLIVNPLSTLFMESSSGGLGGSEDADLQFNTLVSVPPVYIGKSGVTLTLARSMSGSLVKSLADLTGYPYGCVEQIMSAALPNAVVSRAFVRLGVPEALTPELGTKVNQGVQKLYALQHEDGGWGWWFNDATDPYMTAWVLLGLSLTRQAGFEVADGVTDLAVRFLKNYDFDTDPPGLATQAFTQYSLAVAGKGQISVLESLAGSAEKLDSFSLAALALALHLQGEQETAARILDRLLEGLERNKGEAYFPIYDQDGEYHRKTMASAIRTTALAMQALIEIHPEDARISEMESYLMSHREDFGWGTTNETAFSVLALTSRLEQLQNDPRPAAYSLSVNGKVYNAGDLETGDGPLIIEISAAELESGQNLFHLTTPQGGAPLYYTVTSRMLIPEAASTAAGAIKLARSYQVYGEKFATTFHPGDLVQVSLTYTLAETTSYLMIEDSLPGGLEAVNNNLDTNGPGTPSIYADFPYFDFSYDALGYNQKEIRGSRVLFFISEAKAGQNTITYLARVGRSGNYQALPCQTSAMYDASQWGRSASTSLVVLP